MAACLKLYNMDGTGLRFGPNRLANQRVATLAGFAAAHVSIEQIDGAVFRRDVRPRHRKVPRAGERAISLLDKESWLRVAGEWIKLAQDAEQRRGRH
jgi:hypothetical protein